MSQENKEREALGKLIQGSSKSGRLPRGNHKSFRNKVKRDGRKMGRAF